MLKYTRSCRSPYTKMLCRGLYRGVFFFVHFLQSTIWAQYLEIIAESDNMGLAVWNESWGLGWVGRM